MAKHGIKKKIIKGEKLNIPIFIPAQCRNMFSQVLPLKPWGIAMLQLSVAECGRDKNRCNE